MKNPPRISIVVPSFNQAQFIGETLQSLVDQEYPNLQVVIQEGGSTDGSVDIARAFAGKQPGVFQLFVEKDSGQADALNRGFARVDGEILGFLNSDDTLFPKVLHRVAAEIDPARGRWVVMGRSLFIGDEKARYVGVEHPAEFVSHFEHLAIWKRGYNTIPQPSVFWHRTVWERCGGFDTSEHHVLDYDLFCRMSKRYHIHRVDELWSHYRMHDASKSAQRTEAEVLDLSIRVSRKYWGSWLSPLRWRCEVSHWLYDRHLHERARHHARKAEEAFGAKRLVAAATEFLKTAAFSPVMARDRLLYPFLRNKSVRLLGRVLVQPAHFTGQYPDGWIGPVHRREVHIPRDGTTLRAALAFHPRPGLTRIAVELLCNGSVVDKATAASEGPIRLRAPVTASRGNVVAIEIRSSSNWVPKLVYGGEDNRRLSLILSTVVVDCEARSTAEGESRLESAPNETPVTAAANSSSKSQGQRGVIETIKKSALVQRLPPPAKRVLKRLYYNFFRPHRNSGEVGGSLALSPTAMQEVEAAIVHLYQLALLRTPSADERQAWIDELRSQRTNMATIVERIAKSEEAAQVQDRARILPQVPNGRLVQLTYDLILGHGAQAADIFYWDHRLQHQGLKRDQFVLSLFVQRIAEQVAEKIPTYDPRVRHVNGTDRIITVKEWQEIAISVPKNSPTPVSKVYPSLRLSLVPGEIVVSAIASLYRGGDFIEQFLENITAQTIFSNTELIIIDANSPEKEFEVISRYMMRFPNIVYHRASTRIGIYEAWNLGVELSKGRYITNTNLDDLRRVDSFERQVEILEKFQFADVVYQDFYYSFEGDASFERSAATGIRSELPVISPYSLLHSNPPHNAPMWRRSLHGDVGMFDTSLRSAGDFEFWLRCCRARKMFYKINDPHVVYFVNPKGVSTQPNTPGIDENNRVIRQYCRELISEWIVTDEGAFIGELCSRTGESVEVVEDDRTFWDWRYSAVQRALRQLSISSRVRPR